MTDLSRGDVRGRTLTAFFDTRGAADQAVADLEAAGIPRGQIRSDGGSTTGTAAGESGFLASLKDLFMPEEDRYGYAEGLRRGGFLVSVATGEENYSRVMDILDRDGAVDMDEREASWRKEGWTGYSRDSAARVETGTTGGMTGSLATAAGSTTATAASAAGERRAERDVGVRDAAAGTDYIPIVEERLNVGKRDVSHGRVRLRSYAVERAVEEQVSLHDETVRVERHAVDRAVTPADEALFAERTIEAEEWGEEAVVGKEARVVEEIGLRKEAADRTETVRDTVRRTEVEVEDERGRSATGVGGAMARFAEQIRENMEVVGSDGAHVGTVDHLDGNRIKLKKDDAASGGQHHYLAQDAVGSVADRVVLAVTAAEAKARWATA